MLLSLSTISSSQSAARSALVSHRKGFTCRGGFSQPQFSDHVHIACVTEGLCFIYDFILFLMYLGKVNSRITEQDRDDFTEDIVMIMISVLAFDFACQRLAYEIGRKGKNVQVWKLTTETHG